MTVLALDAGLLIFSPNNAARRPSGAKSVRCSVSPDAGGRSYLVYPRPLVNFVACPTHWSSTPNQTPSTSLSGGAQTPPISPLMCQPLA